MKNGEVRVWGGPGRAERKPVFVDSVLSRASKRQGLDGRGSSRE